MRRRALCAASSGGSKYLTMEALENGFTAKLSRSSCEYSIDGGVEWKALAAEVSTPSINAGEKILFKANAIPTFGSGIGTFTLSKQCNLSGNCMSMLYGDDADKYTHIEEYGFRALFKDNSNIITVSSNFLPATTLADRCYSYMFRGCTSLTTAPTLPATTLADSCYDSMFYDCTSLITAPTLPATTLANRCYHSMFRGCTSLTTAPTLPATTLANSCYYSMFYDCMSLTTAPTLPATILETNCYYYMFYNCVSLNYIKALLVTSPGSSYTKNWLYQVASKGTFVKNKNASWNTSGTSGVPNGWTVITE